MDPVPFNNRLFLWKRPQKTTTFSFASCLCSAPGHRHSREINGPAIFDRCGCGRRLHRLHVAGTRPSCAVPVSACIKPRRLPRAEACPPRIRCDARCAVSHRSSPNWLMCAQVHAATDEYQGRPLRRPGRLRRALAAAERAPRQLRRPGRQEQHLGGGA